MTQASRGLAAFAIVVTVVAVIATIAMTATLRRASAQGAATTNAPAATAATATNPANDSTFAAFGASRPGRVHVVRLRPWQDLRTQLLHLARQEHLKAAYVASVSGSVKQATLRFSMMPNPTTLPGPFEIVSLTGTLSEKRVHLHASFADSTGRTVGGHLMDGCPVNTTAEIVVVEAADLVFDGKNDPATGFSELTVRPRGAEDRE
jgi:predicted DNA-binding protein with PD1-like motif